MNEILLSIITICLNEEKSIRNTLESVLNQTSTNYEYIVKDGESTDKTNEIIMEYKEKFMKKGILLEHIIKKDNGIYDAMNQAVDNCKGSWINFMNSGDEFYNSKVLYDISLQILDGVLGVGVVYGHTLFRISSKLSMLMNHDISFLEKRWSVCHQSSFIHIQVMKNYPFDCSYTIGADYDQFLRMKIEGIKFLNLNIVISAMNREGISNTNIKLRNYEDNILKEKYKLKEKKRTNTIISCLKEVIIKICPQLEKIAFVRNQMKRIEKYR